MKREYWKIIIGNFVPDKILIYIHSYMMELKGRRTYSNDTNWQVSVREDTESRLLQSMTALLPMFSIAA